MSDLQCAAGFVFTPEGDADQDQPLVHSLATDLGSSDRERIALVYTADTPSAVRVAEIAAGVLAVPVRAQAGLGAVPGQEPDADVTQRFGAELAHMADQHRGETVLVIADARALSLTLPSLARNVPASYPGTRPLRPGGAVQMRVDADGWVLDSWMGDPPH